MGPVLLLSCPRGQLSHFWTIRDCALLCCPGEGPLSQMLQLLRGQEQFYSKTSGAALPAVAGSERLGGHLSLTHATTRQRRGSVRIPTLKFSGLLHLYPCQ